jgi:hypothetical protein
MSLEREFALERTRSPLEGVGFQVETRLPALCSSLSRRLLREWRMTSAEWGISVGPLYPKKMRHGLPRWKLPENCLTRKTKRSLPLDLARMQHDPRDVKSGVSRNLDQTKFSGIESPLGLLKG